MRKKLHSFGWPAALALAAVAVLGCTERPFVEIHGDPEGTALETFVQTENTSATILWVIDNSGSMCEEQFNVRSNLQSFISSFLTAAPGATFHMGVTTTDTSNVSVAGRLQNSPQTVVASPLCPTPPPPLDCTTGLPSPLPKWVDESTPDIERTFGCISSVGIMGFGGETALGGARMALSPTLLADPMANAGFFIDGSLLVVIFLGDEDDCTVCSGSTCAPLPGLQFNLDCSINRVNELTPINDFVSYIQSLPNGSGTVGDSVLVAAIIGLDPMGNSMGPIIADPGGADSLVPICSVAGQGSAAPAPRIEGFTRGFNDHLEFSICDTDYGPELATIGSRIGSLLQSGCLQHPPCPGVTDEQVVVRVISNGMTTELSPDQYDIVCAGGMQTCPNSADAACGVDGYRIDFLNPALVPPGATVEVHYAFDTGDGCVAE